MSTLRVNNVTDLGDDAVVTDGALVGAGKVLQVVSVTKTDVFSSTSAAFTNVTGLAATITPTSATSKILVLGQVSHSQGPNVGGEIGQFKVTGGNIASYVGDTASNRTRSIFGGASDANMARALPSSSLNYLDSPATTSATTYQLQVLSNTGATVYVNRSHIDTDAGSVSRGASTITLMEIAG